MDIVERLRQRVRTDVVGLSLPVTYFKDTLCQEAADAIERLREALKRIAEDKDGTDPWQIAENALQQKDSE